MNILIAEKQLKKISVYPEKQLKIKSKNKNKNNKIIKTKINKNITTVIRQILY